MMDRWLNTYGFTIDLITEACQRTVSKIGQPSFQYAEGILSKWKEQGVRSMADVEQRDAEHQKRKKTASDQNAAQKPLLLLQVTASTISIRENTTTRS